MEFLFRENQNYLSVPKKCLIYPAPTVTVANPGGEALAGLV